jgi:hypothetical protein
VVKNLVGIGYKVHAIVRNRGKANALFGNMPEVQLSEADLRNVTALKTVLKNTEYLYLNLSTQTTDLNIPFAAEREGVANIIAALDKNCIKQIISISGLGAFDNQQDSGKFKFIPNIIRKQGHKLIKESGIPYTILHCTWFADSFVFYRRNNIYSVIGDTENPIFFTNCYDYSRHLDNAVGNSDAFFKEYPVQGEEGLKHPEAETSFLAVFSENNKVKPMPGWIFGLLGLFKKEMKFLKHMSDYFNQANETFLAEECGTYKTLGLPSLSLTKYAEKLRREGFYDYLSI